MMKMKKTILILILAALFLTACGGTAPEYVQQEPEAEAPVENSESPVQEEAVPDPESDINNDDVDDNESVDDPVEVEKADFALLYRGFIIEMDQNIDLVLDALGEPLGVFEAPSCAFDGIDRIFGFPGIQIHTYPKDDGDFVHTISLRDDSIRTTEGIYLGVGAQEVFDTYGNDFELEFDMCTYTSGQTTLSFFIEEGMVMAITYGLIME